MIHFRINIPGMFWFGRFDVMKKMVSNEEITEYSATISGTDGHSTIDEGTEKPSFREGLGIALATASICDEDGSHFYPQKSAKIKRFGNRIVFYLILGASLCQCTVADDNKDVDSTKSPVIPAQESIEKMVIQEGYEVKLVASEPLVNTPIAVDFDTEGRIWVVEMNSFMPDTSGMGEEQPNGKIAILEDDDQDGVMDRRKIFLDSLVLPRGLCLIEDGLLVIEPPNLWYYAIIDDHPSERILVDAEYAIGGNVEHQPNGLYRATDNWIYSANSEKRYRKKGEEWIIERTQFRGQWGICQDDYGRLYYNNNSQNLLGDYFPPGLGANNINQETVSGFNEMIVNNNQVYPIHTTPGVNRGYRDGVLDQDLRLVNFTAACSPVIDRGGLSNSAESIHAYVAEPAANLIKSNLLNFEGLKTEGRQTYGATEFLASTDERFRPVSLYNGPDGALYIVDMYRGILEHITYLTPYLKNQIESRKLTLPLNCGRIYRVFPKNQNLEWERIPKEPMQLVKLLTHRNGWVRDEAQQTIIDEHYTEVVPALREVLKASDDPIHQIHAMWTLEGMGMLTSEEVIRLMGNPSWPVRMQALSAVPSITTKSNYATLFSILEEMALEQDSLFTPYIAFVTGELFKYDNKRATNLLFSLAKKNPESPFVADAVISSLSGQEDKFEINLLKELPDTSLVIHQKLRSTLAREEELKMNQDATALLKKYPAGVALYTTTCETCHGKGGNGIQSIAPPLNQSSWVTGNSERLASIVLYGLTGPILVRNHLYRPPEIAGDMPGIGSNKSISDEDIAQLLSFIRQSWQNNAEGVGATEVTEVRRKFKSRQKSFTVKELEKLY